MHSATFTRANQIHALILDNNQMHGRIKEVISKTSIIGLMKNLAKIAAILRFGAM